MEQSPRTPSPSAARTPAAPRRIARRSLNDNEAPRSPMVFVRAAAGSPRQDRNAIGARRALVFDSDGEDEAVSARVSNIYVSDNMDIE